jgi:protein SCO1/2
VQRPTRPSLRLAVAIALVGAVVAGAAALALRPGDARPAQPALGDYGTVPPFSLRDQAGAEVTEAWLRGRLTLVDFVFTRCDTICPVLSMKFARLDAQLRDLPDVRLLSFSVDPEHDTPEVLAPYAARHGADPARWKFVTGRYDAVRTLVEGALMTAMEAAGQAPSGAPDIRHGGHFLLVDRELTIVGIYDSGEAARLDALVRDVRALARRGPAGG